LNGLVEADPVDPVVVAVPVILVIAHCRLLEVGFSCVVPLMPEALGWYCDVFTFFEEY
jgi:uncharacterized membrane protein YfbV (UPF0208 family)